MKKLIALTLVVACLGCFSLGCKPPATEKPATPPVENPADDAADAPAETPAE